MLNEYGMYGWVHDIPTGSKIIFQNVLSLLKRVNNPKILEIGTYVGTSIIEMLKNNNATATVIDCWQLSPLEQTNIKKYSNNKATIETAYDVFIKNIENANVKDRITIIRDDSCSALNNLLRNNEYFDFIYVDGSHKCLDTHYDLILSWNVLKKNGILAIDDYEWSVNDSILESPEIGINHFLDKYKKEYVILSKLYRIFLRKIV